MIAAHRKALLAALAAAAAFLAPMVDDGLTAGEALGALAAALTGGGLVYRVPNARRARRSRTAA